MRAVAFLMTLLLAGSSYAGPRVRVASTTSTQNSGLFDFILPLFEAKTGIKVDVVAVGTGAAIEIGKRGDADAVFVHAKELELKAVSEGYFTDRHDVMYNDFVIVGPKEDPAGLKEAKSAGEAFGKIAGDRFRAGPGPVAGGRSPNIAGARSPFVSRGDNSGTHTKELSLWKKAGIDPKGEEWYLEVGQGMEKTLRIADEKRAYTLTDRATWLASKGRLALAVLFEGDPVLFNQYGVMAVNPKVHGHVKYKEAMEFINYLISEEGQQAISSFKDANGNQLFYPNAGKAR